MMELKEKRLSGERIYEGLIVNVRRDKAELPDGRVTNREVVEHPGGVAVFAMDDQDNVILVRQYRYPMEEAILEIPAGKREPGEDPQIGALRELEEETGLKPDTVIPMGCSYSSPGILTEKIYLFFAKDLKQGECHPDDGEYVELVKVPYREMFDLVRRGEIQDGKTLSALLKASLLLKESEH